MFPEMYLVSKTYILWNDKFFLNMSQCDEFVLKIKFFVIYIYIKLKFKKSFFITTGG